MLLRNILYLLFYLYFPWCVVQFRRKTRRLTVCFKIGLKRLRSSASFNTQHHMQQNNSQLSTRGRPTMK